MGLGRSAGPRVSQTAGNEVEAFIGFAAARGLVSVNGYNIQNIAAAGQPIDPENEHRLWSQYYLHGERGRAGLTENRRKFCRLLWSLWSPTWRFGDDIYARSAAAFDNPDFVDVVVRS